MTRSFHVRREVVPLMDNVSLAVAALAAIATFAAAATIVARGWRLKP
ncbi:MAG: hypothetical protein ACRDNI_13190 [Gaiellaceae bacterium]